MPFQVWMIESATLWSAATTIPWNSDIIDAIIDIAVGFLAGGIDFSQVEVSVRRLLSDVEPGPAVVEQYFDIVTTRGDYR